MQQWEYKWMSVGTAESQPLWQVVKENLIPDANKGGAEGWEMVGFTVDFFGRTSTVCAIFKRPKSN